MISSLKIKLNHSRNFWRNWNVPLVLLERSWWAGSNGIYLVRFGFRMWEILIFKWFLPQKIQTNLKKTGFGRTNGTGHTSLSMKEGSLFLLFCLYLWDPLNQDASDRVLDLFGKLSKRRGAYGVWTCGIEVLEYWMSSSLKIKLNHSWKFWRNWNVPLVLLERSWWAGSNGIYLVRFGFRMWEILIFNWFLPVKIQINSKKPSFGRKNQLRTW
jgi:hypothetical protein